MPRIWSNVKAAPAEERVTQAAGIIDSDHAAVHAGIAFMAWAKFTIAAGASAYLELVTPADKYVHMKPALIASDGPKIDVSILEGVTANETTAVATLNRNRLSTNVAGVAVYSGSTVTNGTAIEADYIGGGGTGGNGTGAAVASQHEIVLKQSTKYAFKITNSGSASAAVFVKPFWYEEAAG